MVVCSDQHWQCDTASASAAGSAQLQTLSGLQLAAPWHLQETKLAIRIGSVGVGPWRCLCVCLQQCSACWLLCADRATFWAIGTIYRLLQRSPASTWMYSIRLWVVGLGLAAYYSVVLVAVIGARFSATCAAQAQLYSVPASSASQEVWQACQVQRA